MKESPLNPTHRKLGARMELADGWHIPRAFRSLMEEHLAARSACAVFDISHISKFHVRGNGAADWLAGLFGRGITACHDGASTHAQLYGAESKAIDTLSLLRESAGSVYLLGHAAAEASVQDRLLAHRAHTSIEMLNVTERLCGMALLGPQCEEVLGRVLRGVELPELRRFSHIEYQKNEILLARLGLHSSPTPSAYEFFCPAMSGISWYESFIAAGAQPCGSAARETLRLRY